MNTLKFVSRSVVLLVFIIVSASVSEAAPKKWVKGTAKHKKQGYVLDHRHKHNYYYPKKGVTISVLPQGYRVVPYRNKSFYFHSGVWYRSSGARYLVTSPPVGMMVSFLPRTYTTVWAGGFPYYYAGGVYYSWVPERRSYIVTELAGEKEVVEDPVTSVKLFIYPKKGQTEQQQATDRYECHSWARKETGFDPTQPGGGVVEGQIAAKQSDYSRAMKACLEARNYSVQ